VLPLARPPRGAPARPVARSGHPRPDQGPRRRSGPRSSPEPGSGRVFGPVLALTTHVPYATLMPGGPQWHPGPLRSPGALRHHPPVRSRVRRPHPDTPGKRPTPLLRSLISGLVLAFAGSRANISRTILSCAGSVVGVGALIAVVTAGHFGQTYAKVYGEANGGIAATYEVTAPTPLKDVGAFEEDMLRAGGEAVALQQMVDSPA